MAEIADPKLIAALNRIAAALERQNKPNVPETSLGDVTYGARLREPGPIPLVGDLGTRSGSIAAWGEGDWTLMNDDKVGED